MAATAHDRTLMTEPANTTAMAIARIEPWLADWTADTGDEHDAQICADLHAVLDERKQLLWLLGRLVDREDRPCRLDHHGYCQEHPGGGNIPCVTATARELLAAAYAAEPGQCPGEVPSVPCVYFDQPGHTPDQKPALAAYERGPDDWPMCPPCVAQVGSQ